MASSTKKPKLIEGGVARDERGRLVFANDFDFADVKRFYMVENASLDTIRGFHGHLEEAKYVLVISRRALVAVVELDDRESPSKENEVHRFILSAGEPQVLHVPGGYANGFRALEDNTKVMFFSTASLEESKNDDYRFPHDYWGIEVWDVSNL